MEIIVKIILFIAIFVGVYCSMILEGINKQKQKLLEKQKELNKQIFGLYQNEQDFEKVDRGDNNGIHK